tara:strand:+ start:1052 stop:1543 length:492 start_codon:yes stop_codon:yes gene_type:complete
LETLARIEVTALSLWFRESGLAFFGSLTLHSLAMALVVGINLAIAFRLLGIVPSFALKPLMRFYQMHWIAVILIFLSGLALLLAYPAKALTNPVFYAKFAMLSVGLIIASKLQNLIRTRSENELNSKTVKLAALTSIVVWVGTITTGRFLAYTNSVLLASRFF